MSEIIDNDIPIPAEAPKKSRARRKKKEFVSPVAMLIDALKFISIAQKKTGETKQTHCMMDAHWIAANDGVLTVATKIEEDLSACPHTYMLADALSKTGEDVSIAQLNDALLSVASGAFKGVVPCVPMAEVFIPLPDPSCAVVNDDLKGALEAAATFVVEGAPIAMHAAVLVQANTCVGTNGAGLVEAWHGIDLPPGLLVPRVAALAVARCVKPLVGFGFSESSVTFWFEDESFIKTQLYMDRYPNYLSIFDIEVNPFVLPDEFFKAVKTIETFARNSHVYFEGGQVLSTRREFEASSYRLNALPDGMAFDAKLLLKSEKIVKTAAFLAEAQVMYFFGDNLRGALKGLANQPKPTPAEFNDDDIPF